MSEAGGAVDQRGFRATLARFVTGVTVVSFATDDGPWGITVNAFSSVSLEPPLVLVSIARWARSHDLMAGKPFAVNVLRVEQEALARRFAGMEGGAEEIPWIDGKIAPRLEGALAYIECEPWQTYDGGDHSLYVGEVVNLGYSDGNALGYYNSRFVSVASPVPSEPPLPYDPFELPYDA